ncbi:hypothetical protein B0H16DRAFT_1456645 [Mycena metata]|uniref:Uncharacterized protein n=1 Tax=Mycena metata TaxID=1033252 RepID=A0AAD7NGG1_9AGAR|nr:hypothetical protein B0H16DRAFT_1456645 [Mycena metata]
MARGRPPLDPATKLARRRESVQKYREKNLLKLNESARIRMHCHRAAIANSDEGTQQHYAKQGGEAATRYRQKKRASTQLPPRREVLLAPRRSPITIRDLAHRRNIQAASCSKNSGTMLGGDTSDEDKHTDEDEDEHPSTRAPPELTLAEQREANRARRPSTCPRCYEVGCAGCACLCEASDVWVEHGGHFFPTCKMCGGEECPGCKKSGTFRPASEVYSETAIELRSYVQNFGMDQLNSFQWCRPQLKMSSSDSPPSYTAAPWPSTPNYHAAGGFEDVNLEEYTGTFYAVITDDWQGFAISKFPRATTWSAEGWSNFQTKWYSTPPSSPSTSSVLSVSRSPSPSELLTSRSPSPSSPAPTSSPSPSPPPSTAGSFASPASPPRMNNALTREELAELAAFRPGPGPISPRRLQQQFARVLGPEAVAPPQRNQDSPPPLTAGDPTPVYVGRRRHRAAYIYDEEEEEVTPAPSRRMRHGVQEPEPVRTFHTAAANAPCQAHLDRATTVWRSTPGADFFFSDDEDEVWEFLCRDLDT